MSNTIVGKKPGIHIKQWMSGLNTNRAATNTPVKFTRTGGVFPLYDTLIDGRNVEISPANTLVRRPGFPKFCSTSYSTDVPKAITGAVLNGTAWKLLDTDKKVYHFDSSTLVSIFTKSASAGQSYFQQVGNKIFFSDGVNCSKWDGLTDQDVTNAGIVAPTAAPTVPNLNWYDSAGHTQTCHAWVSNAVYANTSGSVQNYYFQAPTGEIQWSVVPSGVTLQSQSSPPNWSTMFGVFGGVTVDGTMKWTNCGTPKTWAANTVYTNASFVSNGQMFSTANASSPTTSGSTSINWSVGSLSAGWVVTGVTGDTNTLLVTGLGLSVPSGATIDGITVSLNRASNRANAVSDKTVQLLKAGVAAGSNKAAAGYWPWTTGPDVYTVPTSGGVQQNYGSNTDLWGTTWTPTDIANSGFGVQIVATNGSTRTDAAAIVFPITIKVAYHIAASDISGTVYAQIVMDSKGNLQRVKTGGTSGGSEPTWATTIGSDTTDGSVTWTCIGTGIALPCLFNRVYAYGFHSGSPHISTLSPTTFVQAPILGNNVPISGYGSNDTQVDRNDLYRSADGGSLLLYDTSAPNVNASTAWTINDTAADTDLNNLLVGPVAHANDPPPTGSTIIKYHMGRMWTVVGNLLYFSAGPDCTNGDGTQAWPPANVFTLPSNINGMAPTSQGLLLFTADEMFVVLGGPQLATFWVHPVMKNVGVLSQNCIAQDGDYIVAYTTNKQFFAISPDGQEEIGFSVAPTLAANFSPSSSYVAIHRSGQDQGIFLSDGSTNLIRYNLNTQSWDPIAVPTAGIGPLASIQTAIGTQTLVSTGGGYIINRDPTTFQDSGSSYTAYATVGSLVLSEPGQEPARLSSILVTSAHVGTALTVSVMPNEISGSFTTLPNPVADPWQLTASSTIDMKRYDWTANASALPNLIKHLQVKVTMPTEAFKNEIYTLGLV